MNTRCSLAVATLVGLTTLYILPAQSPAAAGNSQSRYSIITEDDVPGEVVQPPRKKLKKKTAPEAPEAQKRQPSGTEVVIIELSAAGATRLASTAGATGAVWAGRAGAAAVG